MSVYYFSLLTNNNPNYTNKKQVIFYCKKTIIGLGKLL